jgi:glycosyltransferase involved in cell wall biosynthesis
MSNLESLPERSRILLVRGHLANPWELRAWEEIDDRFEVAFLLTKRNQFDVSGLRLRSIPVKTVSAFLPGGRAGALLTGAAGDRYLGAGEAFAWADVVHAEELSFWFAADAARRKARHGYRLVLTVWETIPFLSTYRTPSARGHREKTRESTDLFLPATDRACAALLLEGIEPERIEVLSPGIDTLRFGSAPGAEAPPAEHVIVSAGRLVWEKGHQDVLRALAALQQGLVPGAIEDEARLLVVGAGPEEARLRKYAEELGVAERVEFRSVPYDEMPEVFARASCLVLASLHSARGFHPLDIPRLFWEEQFGLVLIEALAAGLPIVASASGAIPEVCGDAASYFAPGDWLELARKLAEGPLSRPPTERIEHPAERVRHYGTSAMAERLAAAYDRVLRDGSK